jgi:hypothetical protein
MFNACVAKCHSTNNQKKVQSQSNEPKSTLDDRQNFIKTIILLDIFLWCHFNVMSIMEFNAK